MKRIFSVFTTIVLTLSVFICCPDLISKTAVHAAVQLTSEQIANYFNSRVGESYPSNMCLAFIADGFADLGGARSSACCAWNYGTQYLTSTSRDIPIGADVFFSSEGCKYDYIDGNGHHSGHIGVYVGDGYIVHAYSSKIQKMLISTVESHGYTYWGWGVHGDVSLVSPAPIVPDKPVLSVSAATSASPVSFSWNACANTHWYDLRIYKSDDTNIVSEMGIKALSYSYSLSAGSYYANVASVNENGNYTFSDNVSFTVADPPKYPDKPVVTVEVTSENHPVKVSYKACANATDYCIRYYDAEGCLVYAIGDSEDSKLFGNGTDYTKTNHSYTLPAGSYQVKVAAINANDGVWTFSDPVSFTVSASVKGDINTDGEIDRADVDLLMNWLLAVPKTTLKDAEAADMNGDGKLNAVDLTMLKRQVLIKQGIIITLNNSALTLNTEGKSKSYQLTCSYPVAEDVVWKSSNVAVATVKNGLVTAQKDGTVTITATANGVSVSCKVTVKTAYTDTWSDWSDWTATPITASETVEVKTEERSSQVLVSYNMDAYCTVANNPWRRQFRNYSVNGEYDKYGLSSTYGEHHDSWTFSVGEVQAARVIHPGEQQGGDQNGTNMATIDGYAMDFAGASYIFFITSENKDTVYTTYYSSRHLIKTPVVYDN